VVALMSWFEVKSPKRAAKIRLDASFFVIGRGERIPIFHDDPSISREHAAIVIKRATGGVRVRDLGSKNGVLLNGKTIGRYAETDVSFGDTLTIGATTLVLHDGEPPAKAKVAQADAKAIAAAPTVARPSENGASKPLEPAQTGEAKTGEAKKVDSKSEKEAGE
jgi:pSer/pThr/pTyr-binding forkhead associated (FHA) protein